MSRRKPPTDPTNLGDIKVQVAPPELWRVVFERVEADQVGGTPPDAQEVQFRLGFGAVRTAADTVTIELSANSTEGMPIRFEISYRTTLMIEQTREGPSINLDTALSDVAARVGPVVAHPYLREALTSLSTRAGMPPFALPVMNVGAMFESPNLGGETQEPSPSSATKPKRPRKKA